MPKSWRDVLPIHPAAELFPLMSPDELQALGEDIKKHDGLTSSIALWRADPAAQLQLLDGRNRCDAIELVIGRPVYVTEIGVEIETDDIRWHGGPIIIIEPPVDPYAYVISANIRRRHLTTEDKDRLIVQLLKANPTKSNRTVAKLTNTSHPHVAKVRKRAEKVGDVETVSTSIDSKGRQQPAHRTTSASSKPGSSAKFTPERIEQIKNLVARGKTREQIAEIIGCTVGSLQVTCSRLGISLRRPKKTCDEIADNAEREHDADPKNVYSAYLLRVDQAIEWAKLGYDGKVTEEIITLARDAAAAWSKLADQLEEGRAPPPPADDGLDTASSLRRTAS